MINVAITGQPAQRQTVIQNGVITRDTGEVRKVRVGVRRKISRETPPANIAPIRAAETTASVELTPPLCNGIEVQEKVTQEAVVDIERYIHLADKLLASDNQDEDPERRTKRRAA
jgi:hypothetical protein